MQQGEEGQEVGAEEGNSGKGSVQMEQWLAISRVRTHAFILAWGISR